ncbi:hypothetical protein PCC6912_40630 [Chlorogloeopsis fritschii PCC 6912]|uniref:Uncharacterized protein n=1 Tax=Chlorogloeopsis fritschii PCC 6912 TaxID=211165 RepID=A0A3S0Y5P5_CHLFR|nr:hypothetical protein PCC6912_40630 [Chlorogloeopsis fritschii PCC 6912]
MRTDAVPTCKRKDWGMENKTKLRSEFVEDLEFKDDISYILMCWEDGWKPAKFDKW